MTHTNNKIIAKNTLFLFFRSLLILGISLYTSRVILSVLGVDDYGIYNVVGGIVSMLTFLNSAMVQASQRYLSFAQGKNDVQNQNKVFSTSILIHVTIAIIVVLLLETIGLWYVNNIVVLSPERLYAANWIYQFSILMFLNNILVVPYTASVIAHERMDVYAYISIVNYILQLAMVFLLKIIPYDKLVVYGALMLVISYVYNLFYYIYTKHKFVECTFHWYKDMSLYSEMFRFASWAFLGGAGYIARNQGVNLVINFFCGPAVNAARGVAYQVSAAIQTLISSFQQSMNPQITKHFAVGDVKSMMVLVKAGAKFSFLLLLICFVPIIVRPNYVLELWLGNVPEYSSGFLIMVIIMTLITSMGGPLNTAMQSTGNIKLFQIVLFIIMCCDIPFAYFFLSIGLEPYLVTGVSILTSILCLFAKLFILRMQVVYNVGEFIVSVVFRNIFVAIVIISVFIPISKIIPFTFWGFLLLCIFSVIFSCVIIYLIGIGSSERKMIRSMLPFYKKVGT